MGISDIVNIQISTSGSGPSLPGFGVPLIPSFTATWAERVRIYSSLNALAADFADGTPEHLWASKIFEQIPRPSKVMVGRCANKPTLSKKITVKAVKDSTDYIVTIGGVAFKYTSGVGATNDAIANGLAAAITGVAGFTAASTGGAGVKYVTVTGNAPANFTTFEIGDVNLLEILGTTADPGISADLDAIRAESSEWYFVSSPFNSPAILSAIAAWVEGNAATMHIGDTNDTAVENHAYSTTATDIGYTLALAGYARTALYYHRDGAEPLGPAVLGRMAPTDPGSESWALKTVKAVSVEGYSDTNAANMRAKSVNFYASAGGLSLTLGKNNGGVVVDGEFIDIIRFRDWIAADMGVRVLAALANQAQGKLPFDDSGIAAVQAAILATLKEGVRRKGLIATSIGCTVPKASDISAADRAARKLTGVEFTGQFAGAIHAVDPINGSLST